MLPPKDVPASELFLKLALSPKPSEVVDFPRKGPDGKPIDQIRIQVLALQDHDFARMRGHARVKEKGIAAEDFQSAPIQQVQADAIAKEVIAMACTTVEPAKGSDPPVYGKIFRGGADVEKLGADEVAILFALWNQVQTKYGPYERNTRTPEEIDAWIKRLAEGGSEFPLLSIASPALVEFTHSLAVRTFTLYRLLASQWESLPDGLRSSLQDFSLAIASSGKPADTDSEDTGSDDSSDGGISMAAAEELVRMMRSE